MTAAFQTSSPFVAPNITPAPGATDDAAPLAPIRAFLAAPLGAVLAVIIGAEGPSYRPVGAMMAIFDDGRRVGTLSSGCIEADIALHAAEVAHAAMPRSIRYGQGSPFGDITLPCGGGLDILLCPAPDLDALTRLCRCLDDRRPATLTINTQTGRMHTSVPRPTERVGDDVHIRFNPELRFLVFGKGPEASTFAGLARFAGYETLLLSPSTETIETGTKHGCATRLLTTKAFPAGIEADDWSAVTLFFHDHDWEPPILSHALRSPAFYIGAQGSSAASAARAEALRELGHTEKEIARLHGPIGLIKSARDARTLAISVLAEVLQFRP